MGFFKDVRALSKMGKEAQANMDVAAMNANAMAQMSAMNEQMSAMAGQATQAAAITDGVAAIASVTAVRNTGSLVNFSPVLELDLLVMVPGRPPVPVTRRELVPQHLLARAQVGAQLPVTVSASDPTAILINWG